MSYGQRRGLYRSRSGAIFGVCKGLARYFDFSVFWIRFIAVLVLLLSGLWPAVGIYLIAALMMKPEPVRSFETQDEQDFYDSYMDARRRTARQLRRRYENLDRRIRRMEDRVTSRDYDWESRMSSG
jgi:phage shock protein C